MSGETYGTFLFVSFLVMTALYFLPAYLAFRSRHPDPSARPVASST